MCLGVPGRVVEIQESPIGITMGHVSFNGVVKEVCLAYVPDVEVGEFVVVHVGFAISKIDEHEAQEVFRFLESMNELDEIHIPQPGDADPSLPPRFGTSTPPSISPAGGS